MEGYDTERPCFVCGEVNDNKVEPRFGYVVCRNHYDSRPVDIHGPVV